MVISVMFITTSIYSHLLASLHTKFWSVKWIFNAISLVRMFQWKNIQKLMDVSQQHYHLEFKWHAKYARKIANFSANTNTVGQAQLKMQFIR